MSDRIQTIREKLTAACDAALAKGWRIRPVGLRGMKREGEKLVTACCLLGTISDSYREVDQILGLTSKETNAIWQGFDDNPQEAATVHPDLYNLGREFRAKYIEGQGENNGL